jgi:hypothetical protein
LRALEQLQVSMIPNPDQSVLSITIDNDMGFHLEKRAAQLSLACIEWESRVRPIPCAWEIPNSWGPPPGDIACAAHSLYHAMTARSVNGDVLELSEEDDDSESLDVGVGDDVDLMAEVEEVAYIHEYRIVDSESGGDLEYWDEVHVPSSPTTC